MTSVEKDEVERVVGDVRSQYEALELAVKKAEEALSEAVDKRDDFRAKMMSLLKVASSSKSGQKLKAERVERVRAFYDRGVTVCAEIARQTGIPVHLVQGDVRLILRRRKALGKNVDAEAAAVEAESAEGAGTTDDIIVVTDEAEVESAEGSGETELAGVIEGEDECEDSDDGEPGATMAKLRETFKIRGGSARKGVKFRTTKDRSHNHLVILLGGSGVTLPDDTGHMHRVADFVVLEAADHDHGLTLEDFGEYEWRAAEESSHEAPSSVGDVSLYAHEHGVPGVVPPGAAIGRKAVRALLQDFRRKKRRTSRFATTVDADGAGLSHSHVADLSVMGDGETMPDGTGHKHRFANCEIIAGAADHSHGLTASEK